MQKQLRLSRCALLVEPRGGVTDKFVRRALCVASSAQDFEVDDLGGLMSVVVTNAYGTEEARGSLGLLNWLGDRLLHLAHLARPNTIEGEARRGTCAVAREIAAWRLCAGAHCVSVCARPPDAPGCCL